MYKYHGSAQVTHCLGERDTILYMWGSVGCTMGTAAGYWWQWNITMCIYTMVYIGLGVQTRCPGWAHTTDGLCDADKGAMKAEG